MELNKYLKLFILIILVGTLVSCMNEQAPDQIVDIADQSTKADLFCDVDIVVAGDFKDGEVVDINPDTSGYGDISKEEFFAKAFEEYGIKISPRQLNKISDRYMVDFFELNWVKFIHLKDFDIIYVEIPGYRNSKDGNLFVFENQIYKGCIVEEGRIDKSDVFKAIDDKIWLVTYQAYGGSELSGEFVNWTDLTHIDFQPMTVFSSFRFSGAQGLYQFYEEEFVELKHLENGSLVLVTHYTEKISDPEEIIVFERSGEQEISIGGDQRRNFAISMIEENLSDIQDYANNGSEEEQEAAQVMMDYYNKYKE